MQEAGGLEIRAGSAADLPELRRILTAAAEPVRAQLPPEAYSAYLEMVLAIEERLEVAELLVVTDGGRPIGTVTYFGNAADEGWGWPEGFAGLRSMGVDPRAQGSGAGSLLLAACRSRALAGGCTAIALHTAHFLPSAIRLYERHGYVRDPDHDVRASQVMRLSDPAFDYAALAYRLDLRPDRDGSAGGP